MLFATLLSLASAVLAQTTGQRVLVVRTTNTQSVDYFRKALAQNLYDSSISDVLTVEKVNTLDIASTLYDAGGNPKYAAIVFGDGECGYLKPNSVDDWESALTPAQWQVFDDYETKYKTKRVMFNVFPNVDRYGTINTANRTNTPFFMNDAAVQPLGVTFDSATSLDGSGLYFYRSSIPQNVSFATPLVYNDAGKQADTVVGVMNAKRGTVQMVYHFPCASWNDGCNKLGALWVPWVMPPNAPRIPAEAANSNPSSALSIPISFALLVASLLIQ